MLIYNNNNNNYKTNTRSCHLISSPPTVKPLRPTLTTENKAFLQGLGFELR